MSGIFPAVEIAMGENSRGRKIYVGGIYRISIRVLLIKKVRELLCVYFASTKLSVRSQFTVLIYFADVAITVVKFIKWWNLPVALITACAT